MARFTTAFPIVFARSEARRAGAAVSSRRAQRPAAAPDIRPGAGWFDSSWDLQSGLEVREGLPDDAKLQEWIEAFCLDDGAASESMPQLLRGAALRSRATASPSSITASA